MECAPFYHDVARGPADGAAHWVTASDGVRLRIAHWPLEGARGTVLLFPGRTEYVEKYALAAEDLRSRGYAMIGIDWRGQGLAGRLLTDRSTGHVQRFADYQHDVAGAIAHARALDLPEPFHLIAHSMGGAIGLRAVMAGLPVNSAVFTGPMWGILLSSVMRPAAWAMSWAGRKVGVGHVLAPGTKPVTYVLDQAFEGNNLTTDADMYHYMRAQVGDYPDLAVGGPSLHWVHEALRETRALRRMASPDLPCLTFLGGDEQIVDREAIRDRMGRWHGGELTLIDGAQHEVMMEPPATRVRIFDAAVALFDANRSSIRSRQTA
ncbi:lysophospholipase [Salinihabitans flavidus]|uniref:Lysophospholipase n=1 Tax=Salinihabitans flavidus TaxID=569882 RepID=A0A1H8T763_9RHOB|nr:alpha/beta hydrolase [Salinihabitans flavidus]SEO86566.1 lysophospholipase [Salinihabitans flavidus]